MGVGVYVERDWCVSTWRQKGVCVWREGMGEGGVYVNEHRIWAFMGFF